MGNVLDAPYHPACRNCPGGRLYQAACRTAGVSEPLHWPVGKQIAAHRCRAIGEVIVDICRDLAILPSHPLWRQLQKAISTMAAA
jgi:hypothetical protein